MQILTRAKGERKKRKEGGRDGGRKERKKRKEGKAKRIEKEKNSVIFPNDMVSKFKSKSSTDNLELTRQVFKIVEKKFNRQNLVECLHTCNS